MPGIFIGSTELTTVGDIKIGGTDVQEIFVGATKVFPIVGGLTPIFTWNSEIAQALPGSAIFTRASDANEFTDPGFILRSSNVIRDQHKARTGGAPGYIAEPAATNQVPTTDLSDALWNPTDLTVTDNGDVGFGFNEYELDDGTVTAQHAIFAQVTVNAAGSAYFICEEGINGRYVLVARGTPHTVYDLQTGTITENTGLITDLNNGRYKCEIINLDVGVFLVLRTSDVPTPGTAVPVYPGNNDTFLSFHAQYEITEFSTTPISTPGSPRAADVLDSGVVIPAEFGALFDFTAPDVVGTGNTISLLGASTSAVDILRLDASFNVIMDDGGTPTTLGTVAAGQRFKVSYGRDATGRSGSVDGATAVTGDAPSAAHEGENFHLYCTAGANQARGVGHLSNIYNVKPSDAELEGLSS